MQRATSPAKSFFKDKGTSYTRWGNFRGNKKMKKFLSKIIHYTMEYF